MAGKFSGDPDKERAAANTGVNFLHSVGIESNGTEMADFKGIDLGPSNSLNGVPISENLPEYEERWHVEEWHECINTLPSEIHSVQNDGPLETGTPSPPAGDLRGEDRWNFVLRKLINIESYTCTLTRDVNTLSGKVDAQAGILNEVKTATAANEQKIEDLYKKQNSILAGVDQRVEARLRTVEASIQQENAAFQAQVLQKTDEKVRIVTEEIRDEFIQEQCESRRFNLLFVGLKELEGEEPVKVITSFLKNRMQITGVRVDSAYRLGKPGGDRPRPILARFPVLPQRQRIWFSKSKIKPSKEDGKVWIHEDLPKAAKHVQRTLYRVLKKAKSIEGRFDGAHIKGQSLYIDGKAYREENLESLPDVLRPSNLAIMQSDNVLVFFGRFTPLSNHHPSPFHLNGQLFTCMEQFLAWNRASLAEDQELISKALSKADPIVYKGILNDLRDNKPEEWKRQVENFALLGLMAKFQQNPPLAHFLCSTHPKTLGEASPSKTWGIGLILTHPDVLQTDKWSERGNLLGKSLMTVREELMITKNA